MMANLPDAYFTPQSILTLSGATGAVYVVCGAVQHVFGVNPRWLALVISLVIALVGAYATQPRETATFLIALVNGCLIYCTAVGVNSVFGTPAGGATKGVDGADGGSPPQRSFTTRWF